MYIYTTFYVYSGDFFLIIYRNPVLNPKKNLHLLRFEDDFSTLVIVSLQTGGVSHLQRGELNYGYSIIGS